MKTKWLAEIFGTPNLARFLLNVEAGEVESFNEEQRQAVVKLIRTAAAMAKRKNPAILIDDITENQTDRELACRLLRISLVAISYR